MVVTAANVREVVLNTADVIQRVHVVEAAPGSGFLELHWVRGFVLGQPESVHGVVSAQFPPQPWVISAQQCSTQSPKIINKVVKGYQNPMPYIDPCYQQLRSIHTLCWTSISKECDG